MGRCDVATAKQDEHSASRFKSMQQICRAAEVALCHLLQLRMPGLWLFCLTLYKAKSKLVRERFASAINNSHGCAAIKRVKSLLNKSSYGQQHNIETDNGCG